MVDFALGFLLVALAAGALYSRTLYGSITLFFAFGMLMALAWTRLRAPDLALAEAAIGAGLTGALMLNALSKSPPKEIKARRRHLLSAGLLSVLILLLVIQSLWPALQGDTRLPGLVQENMAKSGVKHPVTAVLLNFRSWDTLLELTVLLLALLGVNALKPTHTPAPQPWDLLLAWGRTLAPVSVVVAGFLLWRGSHGAGGAFQAGALLAAGAVMLRLNHVLPSMNWSYLMVRITVVAGVAVFLAAATATVMLGGSWLEYPPSLAKPLILLIEITASFSIAAALTLLVVGEGEELQS